MWRLMPALFLDPVKKAQLADPDMGAEAHISSSKVIKGSLGEIVTYTLWIWIYMCSNLYASASLAARGYVANQPLQGSARILCVLRGR